ncbi:MAG: PAS domain S-box protein [Deltaproteobacteria bacterium]|nr:PAS domain S-box protein [Deltaproteobacteria bacterium]
MFSKNFANSTAFHFLKVLSVILLASALVLSVVIATNEKKLLEHSLADKGHSLASYIGKLSQDPLILRDGVLLDAIVNDANKDEDLVYAVIRDADGNLLTSKYASINYRFPRMKAILSKLPIDLELQEILAAIGKEEAVKEISMPILIDVKTIGTVTLGLSQQEIRREVSRTIGFVIALNLLAAVAMGIVLFVFSRKIFLAPIATLAAAAVRLAKGDLSTQVTMKTTGEVTTLVDSFNRMAGELERTTVSKNYMNNVFRSMIDTLVTVSPDGTIKNCNAAVCSLLEYEEEELIGKPFESILGENTAGNGPVLEETRKKGAIRNREIKYAARGGRIIPMLLSVSPMVGAKGEFEGIVCAAQDVTVRKQAEEKLARLGMAVEQAGEAIIITDNEGTIQYVNPAFERVSGYVRDEVVGKNPRILKSGKHDPDYYQAMWNTLKQGKVWTGTVINRNKGGSLYEEVAVISPVRDATGQVVNYVAVKRDVTHEMDMEEQLRQSQKMEAVGQLAGGIAHDFNNLLTAISGYSELLLGRLPGESPFRREVEEIRKAGDRASALTRQLLAFSRRQMFQVKVVDLNRIVSNLDKMLRRLIGEDIDLRSQLKEDLWNVRIDPGQMEQVVINIAVNARDAMPRGGKLTIETANIKLDETYVRKHVVVKPGPYVMLAVSDNGCGMDEATQAHIFEPFFTTKDPGKGTGLGLSTVYGIVKQSSGYIWVYSEPGRGTTFKVYLPRVLDKSEQITSEMEPIGPGWGGRETILLAEDEELVRDLVAEILKPGGYSVLQARDGEEAVRISEHYNGTIDLLVTDVVMPHIGGRELVRRIQPARPEMKVIYMSGYTENAIVHHGALDAGINFIQKPFRPGDLSRKIREVLDAPLAT